LPLDWTPGHWLSSWESRIKYDQAMSVERSALSDNTWLVEDPDGEWPEGFEGEEDYREYEREKDSWSDEDDSDEDDYDRPGFSCYQIDEAKTSARQAAQVISSLMACWPNPPEEIAGSAGLEARELKRLATKEKPPSPQALSALSAVLGVEDEWPDGPMASGPFALVARDRKALGAVLLSYSRGARLRAFEIDPQASGPGCRHMVLCARRRPPIIVMEPRGSSALKDWLAREKADERKKTKSRKPMNIGPHKADPELGSDAVSAFARASREAAANVPEMRAFGGRHQELWADGAWPPD
jgi:hypothetical protein